MNVSQTNQPWWRRGKILLWLALGGLALVVCLPPGILRKLPLIRDIRLAQLIRQLQDTDWRQRQVAAELLERRGPQALKAVPGLINASKDHHPLVRCAALKALGKTGAHSPAVMTALTDALTDREDCVRLCASQALAGLGRASVPTLMTALRSGQAHQEALAVLGAMGLEAEPAMPVLLELLGHDDLAVRDRAAEALVGVGLPAVSALLPLLKGRDSRFQAGAARALGLIRPVATNAIPPLTEALKDENEWVRRTAADALRNMGVPGQAALNEALKGEDPNLRYPATLNLSQVPIESPEAVPRLARELRDENLNTRFLAATALGRMGAIPALIEGLTDHRKWVRDAAANGFQWVGKAAVPPLLDTLQSRTLEVRAAAVFALGLMGPEAAEAVSALVALLKDRTTGLASLAVTALGNMGKPAVPALLAAMPDNDAEVSQDAAFALKNAVKTSADAAPRLLQVLQDPRHHVRWAAVYALGGLDTSAAVAAPALVDFLKKETAWDLRFYAAYALGKIKPAAAEGWPVLLEALKHNQKDIRRMAAEMIGEFRHPSGNILAALIQLLRDEETRSFASSALCSIGQATSSALLEALKDSDLDLRREAALVLLKVNPQALKEIEEATPR